MHQLRRTFAAAIAVAAMALAVSPLAHAQGRPDFTAAPAGTYNVDASHAAVVARVPHMGFSYSVFRFGAVAGSLAWDPVNPTASRLNVTVETASITTPVEGFAAELAGDRFLKSAQFPQATFASTAFRRTDATHGQVDGNLTLLGVTKPVTFDVTLIGAGPGRGGNPVIGIEGQTRIQAADFGLAPFLGQIELQVDVEFDKSR